MILNREHRQFRVLEPLDRLVVQVDVREFEVVGQGCGADGEGVVLGGDLDAGGEQVADGVVCAVVSEGHLLRLRTEDDGEDLVAEADAEDGGLADQVGDGVDDTRGGILDLQVEARLGVGREGRVQ